jgi:hypothetical protein
MSRARRKRRRRTWRRLLPSPIAVTLDGTVLVSVGLYDDTHDAEAAIRTAVDHGGRVFIGVELHLDEVAELRSSLDDAAFESLTFLLGARPRRRKRRGSTPRA